MQRIAVLTGDLIGSTEAPPAAVEATMARLAEAAAEVGRWQDAPARFIRHRGDGWQMVVTGPALGLRAALYILACLRAEEGLLGSRIAIGLGPAESLGTRDLSDARGPAFEISGRGLDGMSRLRQLALDGPGLTRLHPIVVQLLEEHARHWTREQAEAAAMALHPDNPTLGDIAPRLGISSQAVSYRFAGGSVQAIRRALKAWEEAFELHDSTGGWGA